MIDFEGGVLRGARRTLLVRPRQNQGGSLPHANDAATLGCHLLSRPQYYAGRFALLIAVDSFQYYGSERYARPRKAQQDVRSGVCMLKTNYSVGVKSLSRRIQHIIPNIVEPCFESTRKPKVFRSYCPSVRSIWRRAQSMKVEFYAHQRKSRLR